MRTYHDGKISHASVGVAHQQFVFLPSPGLPWYAADKNPRSVVAMIFALSTLTACVPMSSLLSRGRKLLPLIFCLSFIWPITDLFVTRVSVLYDFHDEKSLG